MKDTPFYIVLKEDDELKHALLNCTACIIELAVAGNADPVTKFRTAARIGGLPFYISSVFKMNAEAVYSIYKQALYKYPKFNAIMQDFYDYLMDEGHLPERDAEKLFEATNTDLANWISQYIEFKESVNTVSDEVSDEVERLANMTDEEFQAEMEKEDEEDEKKDSESEDDEGDGPVEDADDPSQETDAEDPGDSDDSGDAGEAESTERKVGIPMSIINPKQ